MTPEQLEFIQSVVDEGIFVHIDISVWQASKTISSDMLSGLPSVGISDQMKYERTFSIPKILKASRLAGACRIAMGTLGFKTAYGYFIPGPNIERFRSEMEEFRTKLEQARDAVVADYDSIISVVEKQARELAVSVWRIRYEHDGEPHIRFTEKFASDYVKSLGTAEDIRTRYRFSIAPSVPIIDPKSAYSKMFEYEQNNLAVYENLFERILRRRRRLVELLLDTEKTLKASRNDLKIRGRTYKRLLGKLQRHLWATFYLEKDPDLIVMVKELRDTVIVNDKVRTLDSVIPQMEKIRNHIVRHPFFRCGIEVVNG